MTFKYSQEEQKVFYQLIKNNEPTFKILLFELCHPRQQEGNSRSALNT